MARWEPRPAPYELTFESAASTPVWRAAVSDTAAVVDRRALEDTSGRVVVSGSYQEALAGSDVAVRCRSPGVGYTAAAGAPPSRRRPCRYLDAGGREVGQSPCRVTDGALTTDAVAPSMCPAADPTAAATGCTPATSVVVDLGTALPAELVVVRGCGGGCAVDVSADGRAYRAVGGVRDDFGAIRLDGTGVTAVRVGLGSVPTGLREVSVWGPPPDGPGLRTLDDDARAEIAEPYQTGPPEDDDVPVGLVLTAVTAAAAALLAIGFALGRRRRPAVGLDM